MKHLMDALAKELGPVGDELRSILEKSVDEIHQALKKEGLSTDDLRKALENSHDEMRKAFDKGGAIDKELARPGKNRATTCELSGIAPRTMTCG